MPMPYTLAFRRIASQRKRKYAELALEYAPEQASILDTLGYIAFYKMILIPQFRRYNKPIVLVRM